MSLENARNRARNTRRSRLRDARLDLEGLEKREVMSYSALGYSLPDLTVTGQTGAVAAWGQPLSVTAIVRNLGTSTMIEPLNLAPGSTSSADSPATTVAVLAVPHGRTRVAPILLGNISVPSLTQNNMVQETSQFTLPAKPAGFPGSGGKIDVIFVVNPDHSFTESNLTNNVGRAAAPVLIEAALPDLQTVALDVPPVLNPGDTIQPNIRIANYGTMDTSPQGPVTVELVASLDKNFGPGDSILATYTIDNITPVAQQSADHLVLGDTNLNPGSNIVTLEGLPVTMPAAPGKYYLGVIIDPNNTIKELHEVGRGPSYRLQQVRTVGPNTSGLPPAGVIGTFTPGVTPLFPYPATTSTGAGEVIALSSTAAGSFSSSNLSSSSSTSVGGLQARAIFLSRHKSAPSFLTRPVAGNPPQTVGLNTNLLGPSEQTGSALFPTQRKPTTTVI